MEKIRAFYLIFSIFLTGDVPQLHLELTRDAIGIKMEGNCERKGIISFHFVRDEIP